jgi:predicted RNase H-like HicB family nuclease
MTLDKDYSSRIVITFSGRDGIWYANCRKYGGVIGQGTTRDRALMDALDTMLTVIKMSIGYDEAK